MRMFRKLRRDQVGCNGQFADARLELHRHYTAGIRPLLQAKRPAHLMDEDGEEVHPTISRTARRCGKLIAGHANAECIVARPHRVDKPP